MTMTVGRLEGVITMTVAPLVPLGETVVVVKMRVAGPVEVTVTGEGAAEGVSTVIVPDTVPDGATVLVVKGLPTAMVDV